MAYLRPNTIARIHVGRKTLRAGGGSLAELEQQSRVAFNEILDDLRQFISQLEGYLPEDLRLALIPTMDKSQELVPVNTGLLKDSAYLEAERISNQILVEMGYGKNGEPDYAIAVHELPIYHKPPTQNKFLQQPLEEDYPNIARRIVENLRARTGLNGS